MILIAQLEAYVSQLVQNTPGINHGLVVMDESHLAKQLRDLSADQFPLLVATYPMAQGTGQNWDAFMTDNAIIYFVLEKADQSANTHAQENTLYHNLQVAVMELINQFIRGKDTLNGTCHFSQTLAVNQLSIEPENLIAGCQGWSIGATYKGVVPPTDIQKQLKTTY